MATLSHFSIYLEDEHNDTCLSVKRTNKTVIGNVYEGIPETLLLNFLTWCMLLMIFAILRNKAWDYGRLALVQSEKWTQLFYKNTEEAVPVEESSTTDGSLTTDVGCSWFPTIFKIGQHRVFSRCGPDASHYISFQKHLLLLKCVVVFCALVIILPINFQGQLQGNEYTFGHTTLSNLEPTSAWLWVHVFISFAMVPISIMIMRRCSSRIPSASILSSRTVLVTHISHNHRNAQEIRVYFEQRFPGVQIRDVKMAYKIKNLVKVERQRVLAREARLYCVANNKTTLRLQPHGCIACCPWGTVNALEYYRRQESELTAETIRERARALSAPLGIAFVTLETEEQARLVIDTFQPGSYRKWNIARAPSPGDINWENLQISTRNWYSKAIAINCALFVILFFLTTPAIVVNMLNTYTTVQENFIKSFSPFLAEFVPTLLLLTMSALMPVLVAYSDQWMSHWTKSKQNHGTMLKCFCFLLFMVLILPSLGLTSAQAFLESSIHAANKTVRWDCIFLPDKGAFFVNYVITSALIGTGLELLRFPELAMYVWRLLLMRSAAEKSAIRKEILSVFPFGIHYAWTLLIFTVSTVYSLVCPLIAPFGLLYLSLKHLVDKHNIYYVYKPIQMSGEGARIHATAVRMVRVSFFLLQVIMATFALLRGATSVMAIVTLLGVFATLFCFTFLSPFPACSPRAKNLDGYQDMQEQYVAPVLASSEHLVNAAESGIIQQDYGSSNVNELASRMTSLTNSGSTLAGSTDGMATAHAHVNENGDGDARDAVPV